MRRASCRTKELSDDHCIPITHSHRQSPSFLPPPPLITPPCRARWPKGTEYWDVCCRKCGWMRTRDDNRKMLRLCSFGYLPVTIFTYSVPYSDHLSDHILPHYQRACCLTDRRKWATKEMIVKKRVCRLVVGMNASAGTISIDGDDRVYILYNSGDHEACPRAHVVAE